jgi:hypothetical protein
MSPKEGALRKHHKELKKQSGQQCAGQMCSPVMLVEFKSASPLEELSDGV